MTNSKRILVAVAIAALACVSFGQGRRGGGFGFGPLQLAGRADVQADLKITDDQKSKLSDLNSQMREERQQKMQDAGGDRSAMQKIGQEINAEFLPKLNEILTADQQTRLKQIGYQLAGVTAIVPPFGDPDKELIAALAITDEQIAKIKNLQAEANEANRTVFAKVQSGELQRSEIREIMQKNNDALKAEIAKVLTADQTAKFKALQGEPFHADPEPAGGGASRRGRRGNGGSGGGGIGA